ncbi:hypothetical protein PHYPO_G00083940 [Pangasianodon hypophthalmus]|uniref:Uncharacterized protein n=1 Tax=Pangasianodon hypophthalmus TaxID=310915 RepID=A0A5N5LMD4_PANHP|nr:hypothetical protein PHYPO_G00083940 [Pangasianodon hypophthalmus]
MSMLRDGADVSRSSPTPRLCGVLCPLDSLWTDAKKTEGQQRSSSTDNRKVEIRRSAGKELLQNLNDQTKLYKSRVFPACCSSASEDLSMSGMQ